MKQIVDVTLVTAMGPPGGGRQPMTNRMLRQLHMLSFTEMRPEELEAIFVTITSPSSASTSTSSAPGHAARQGDDRHLQ